MPASNQLRGAVRMREVATLAGVSRMTVSRALNQPDKVKEGLRNRVLDAVAELGYVHNHLARSLSSRRSTVIGLILPNLENSIFAQTVKGISDALRPEGFQLMLAESGNDPVEEERIIAAFVSQRVAGLVLHATRHTPAAVRMLRGAGIPVVENGDMPIEPVDMVASYSNRQAAKAMTLYLAERGYKHIAFAGLIGNPRASERLLGFRDALAELDRPIEGAAAISVSAGLAGGIEAIAHIEKHMPHADALFCAGDVLSVGALFECDRRGWKVPDRLALASFDDVELTKFVNPGITALSLPRYEIGRLSAEMILAQVLDRDMPPRSVDLGFEIVPRASA